MEALFTIEIQILVYSIILISIFSFFSIAPWVPTKDSDLERINKLMKLKPWERFLEIWTGTGKVALYIAKNNPSVEVVGVELSPLLFCIAKIRAYFSGCKNLKISLKNAFKEDFSKYDVLYVFWLPETITTKLQPKLKKELKPGARLFSYCFQMTTTDFEEVRHKEEKTLNSIYCYRK